MILLLVCAYLGAPPAPQPLLPQDRVFAAAVESWAASAAKPRYDADAQLPAHVRRLGHPNWREREAASKALAEDLRGSFRWLITAERSRDAEIRLRAGILLDSLCRCPGDHGVYSYCRTCESSGDLRWAKCWDANGEAQYDLRDLFSPEAIQRAYGQPAQID